MASSITIEVFNAKGAKAIAILWSLYVAIDTIGFISFDADKCKDISVISTSPPNFSISVFKATSLSVSLILSVCRPVKSQDIPKAKQVTAMVWAISGAFFKSRVRDSKLDFSFFFTGLFS